MVEALDHARELQKFVLSQQNKFLTDYEIEFNIGIYSSNKYKHIKELEGSTILSYSPVIGFNKNFYDEEMINWIFEEDHNDLGPNHPLAGIKLSWLMHELYNHTYLSWSDVIDIEDIWFDISLVTQNHSHSIDG